MLQEAFQTGLREQRLKRTEIFCLWLQLADAMTRNCFHFLYTERSFDACVLAFLRDIAAEVLDLGAAVLHDMLQKRRRYRSATLQR